MASENTPPVLDVLIIGGGPAGLSTALSLVRSLHTVVLFDSGVYRNDRANWMHTVPAWDSADPKAYREATRSNLLAKYDTTQFADVTVDKVEKITEDEEHAGLFRVTDTQQRQWIGKKLVLATGVRDILLEIPGYDECWIKGGMYRLIKPRKDNHLLSVNLAYRFHCMVHRGYEERGCASAGVLSAGGDAVLKAALHIGAQVRNITENVTIYTHGNKELTAECEAAMSPLKFNVEGRRIKKLTKAPERAQVVIQFDDGEQKTEAFLVHRPLTQVNGSFAEQLSLEMTELGFIKTTAPFYETGVPGVFAVGDCAVPFKIGTHAVATGAFASNGVQMQLNMAAVKAGTAVA